jgi:hypothetical protein
MTRWICLWAATVVVFTPSSCASGPTYPVYVPTVLTAEEGARVGGSNKMNIWSGCGTEVGLRRVDGCRMFRWIQSRSDDVFLIDPGARLLTVYGIYSNSLTTGIAEDVDLTAVLQAGHVYQLQLERMEELMTFWVEDVATHEAVSERLSKKATSHLKLGSMPAHF